MHSLTGQLQCVFRKLASSPLFTIVAVLTLALGIGANTAIFSVVNGVLLKPLPYDDPECLIGVWQTAPGFGYDLVPVSAASYFTYRDENRTLEDIGMWNDTQVTVTGLEESERLEAMMVTYRTFPILRVHPMLGRIFNEEDDSPGSRETVILSYGYWKRRFGGDPGVVGRPVTVDATHRTIIGVMPSSFRFLQSHPNLFLPFRLDRSKATMADFSYQEVARLRPGTTVDEATADLTSLIPLVSIGLSSSVTMGGAKGADAVFVEDFPSPENQLPPVRRFKWISENYFETVGNPILAGRSITWADIHNHTPVAAVTENFAREYWDEPEGAIGKRIKASMD